MYVMNMKVEGQWGQRTSLSFKLVPREAREEEPRIKLTSEKDKRKL